MHEASLFALLLVSALPAQEAASKPPFLEEARVLYEFRGEKANDQFGWVGRSAGDVDRDGVLDALISAPTSGAGRRASGAIWVFSGKTGKQLHRIAGRRGEMLGHSVASVGDMSGDGHDDFACGAPSPRGKGKAYVFSGKDGTRLMMRQARGKGTASATAPSTT